RRLLRPPVTARRALAALAVVPSCWLVTEWIRSWQGIGGPWAVFGASQWQHPAILALAAVGGVWLVTVALVAASTGIVIALVAGRAPVRLLGAAAPAIAIAARPAGDDRSGPAGPHRRNRSRGSGERAADRRPGPWRQPDRLGGEQHRLRSPAGHHAATPAAQAVGHGRRAAPGQPGRPERERGQVKDPGIDWPRRK